MCSTSKMANFLWFKKKLSVKSWFFNKKVTLFDLQRPLSYLTNIEKLHLHNLGIFNFKEVVLFAYKNWDIVPFLRKVPIIKFLGRKIGFETKFELLFVIRPWGSKLRVPLSSRKYWIKTQVSNISKFSHSLKNCADMN